MRRQPDLWLPRPRRWSAWAIGLSVAVHAAFVLLFRAEPHLPVWQRRAAPQPQVIVLTPPEAERRDVALPFIGRRETPAPPAAPPTPVVRPVIPTDTPPDTGSREFPPLLSFDTTRARGGIGRIRPGLGEGHLWVRPLPLPPRELAQRLSRSHTELVDSAVTAIVQAVIDSVAHEPGAAAVPLPDWTTTIAGSKFGLDGNNIYIAGLKIPAAVLALLPIPGGNIDQSRAYNELMDRRADLYYAARRAQTVEEFKEVIREIRERKAREKEFEENQRTAPPPSPDEAPTP